MFGKNGTPVEIVWSERLFDATKGLKDEHVFQTFEDRRGFLWVITDTELVFFDGKNFFPVQKHSSAETSRNIRIRGQDALGRIWVRYEEEGNFTFRIFEEKGLSGVNPVGIIPEQVPLSQMRDISVDKNGALIILTVSGEVWMQSEAGRDWHTKKLCIGTNFDFIHGNQGEGIWLLSRRLTNDSWVMAFWDKSSDELTFTAVLNLVQVIRMEGDQLVYMTLDQFGFIGADGQVESKPISSFFPEFAGRGIRAEEYLRSFGYNPVTGDAFLIHDNIMELANLKQGICYKVGILPVIQSHYSGIINRSNAIWVGTLEGLRQIQFQKNRFTKIMWVNPVQENFFHKYSTRGIAEGPSGQIFFSADRHLWVLDRASGQSKKLVFTNNMTSDVIWDSKNQRIWTMGRNLTEYDPFGKRVSFYEQPPIFANGYTFGLVRVDDSLLI